MKPKRVTPKRALKAARRQIKRCVLCRHRDVVRIELFVPQRPEHWYSPPLAPEKSRRSGMASVQAASGWGSRQSPTAWNGSGRRR